MDVGDGVVDVEEQARFGIDADGFFLHWKSAGNAGRLVDLALVGEVASGVATPTERKAKRGADVADRSFRVCWGYDFVGVECRVVVCPDVETKEVSNDFLFFKILIY